MTVLDQWSSVAELITALYQTTDKRVVCVGPNEKLVEGFTKAYDQIMVPALAERKAGFVSWNADTFRTWQGVSTLMPARNLMERFPEAGLLGMPLGVSVLNREILIRALKEAQEHLTGNDSLTKDGIRHFEVIVYLRHIEYYRRWLFLDQTLTLRTAGREEGLEILEKAHRAARLVAICPAPMPKPKLLLVYSAYRPTDPEAIVRHARARQSWQFHFDSGDIIDLPYHSLGIPEITALLDYACDHALPEDIIVYANTDAGLTTGAVERVIAGVSRGLGVTCCPNREHGPQDPVLTKDLTRNRMPGGVEVFAMTPQWWQAHRKKMPPMLIGREAWDAVLMTLAEEWSDGRPLEGICRTDLYPTSKAYTDNVCWHQPHFPYWETNRNWDSGNENNRRMAQAFFAERNKDTIWK